MNTKSLILWIVIGCFVLSACAPSLVPTANAVNENPIAQEPISGNQTITEEQVSAATSAESEQLAPIVEAPASGSVQESNQQPIALPTSVGMMPQTDGAFQDYGVNPPENTYEDNLSTFALDVDTASYTVTRNYLNNGNLPPVDAVRVEEFVNYFEGGYQLPEEAAFALYADGAPSVYDSDEIILRIGIQGYQESYYERKPSSLVFVIDTSGSMEMDGRLELIKNSLKKLVRQMNSEDQIGIVTFGSNGRIMLYPTRGDDKESIYQVIESLYPDGSTNAEEGLSQGYSIAMQYFLRDGNNRIIFCSDGVANTGLTNPDQLLEMVGGYVSEGIYLTSIGVGMDNFDDAFLEKLADQGNGNYYYIDSLDQAEKVFIENLNGTLQVIAKDAKIQMDFNPEVVEEYRLLGYENRAISDQSFRDDQQDAGELGAGHSATALYVIHLSHNSEGRIATVQLRWLDPQTNEPTEINGNVNTWDLSNSFYETQPYYQLNVTAGLFAEYLRESPYMPELSLRSLEDLSEAVIESLPEDQDAYELFELIQKAREICWNEECH